MAVCRYCEAEMMVAKSCTVEALHRQGRRVAMIPYGSEAHWRSKAKRCGDCGVTRGGWHHPGCDIQECPMCGRQMLSCGCRFDEDSPWDGPPEALGVDGNGDPTERVWMGGQEVIIHYTDEVPATDITTVNGIRCTTALRTAIDLAAEVEPAELLDIVKDFLDRGLFTVEEAWQRIAEPDMVRRPGAAAMRRVLPPVAR